MCEGNCANNGGKWITPTRRTAIYERDHYSCSYCNKTIINQSYLTLDHVLSQELGGTNGSRNLVTACKACNSTKGSKSIRMFFKWLRYQGVDTDKISKRVRRRTRRKLNGSFRI